MATYEHRFRNVCSNSYVNTSNFVFIKVRLFTELVDKWEYIYDTSGKLTCERNCLYALFELEMLVQEGIPTVKCEYLDTFIERYLQ
jgi:hypothetical protein